MGLSLFLRLLWMQSTAIERSGFLTVFHCFETKLKQFVKINNPVQTAVPGPFGSGRRSRTGKSWRTSVRRIKVKVAIYYNGH